jgi:chaperone BCS1
LDSISGSGNGRIVVITTNHVGKLDPALIQPGRMDVMFKVGMPNEDQLRAAYCAYFCDCPKMRPRMDLKARIRFFPCAQGSCQQVKAICDAHQ